MASFARRLRAELLDIDLAAVEPLTGTEPPDGTKGISATLGVLAVRLGPTALKALIAKIRDWVSRNQRSVKVTIDGDSIELSHATAEQQELLLNIWLARHGVDG